jgi:DNA-binding GntR family transcriptional regulator
MYRIWTIRVQSPNEECTTVNKEAPAEQPLSKTAYVLQRLRREIASGEVGPGQQIRQAEIAERYGVSPTPVREALRLLEADGAIQYTPHRGATVTELSAQELDDLYLIRTAIETQLARLAGDRATPEDAAAIRELHKDLATAVQTESAEDLSVLNREFHLAVLRLGSPLVTQHIVTPLWHGFLPPSKSQWRSPDRNAQFVAEHEELVEALEAGDSDAAGRAMEHHLGSAMKMRQSNDTIKS